MAISVFLVFIILIAAAPAAACTPMPALFFVVASPFGWAGYASILTHTIFVLIGVVFIKCVLFAYKVRSPDDLEKPFITMILANLYSTIPGAFMAIFVAVPIFLLISPPVFIAMNHYSARVLTPLFSHWRIRKPEILLNIVMLVLIYTSIYFFGLSQETLKSGVTGGIYWAQKIAFTFTAVCLSLILTIGYEGSIAIREYKKQNRDERAILQSVAWANVWTMFIATGIAAAAMLPRRFESKDFLVQLIEHLRSLFA